jgi:hypothetical protein
MNVPQDAASPPDDAGKVHKIVYTVDRDGRYAGVHAAVGEPENIALQQAWEQEYAQLAATEAAVKAGHISPIAYFMHKNLMDVALLARYVGKWQWQVRRHMKPAVFQTLSEGLLQKYARIFGITSQTLRNFGRN